MTLQQTVRTTQVERASPTSPLPLPPARVSQPAHRRSRARTLSRQLKVTLVAGGVLLLLIVSGAVYSVSQVLTLQHRVTSTYHDAIVFNDLLRSWLTESSTALDIYQSTEYLPALQTVINAPDLEAGDFQAILADDLGADSEMVASFESLLAQIDDWRTTFVGPAVAAVAAGGVDSVPVELTTQGDELFEQALEAADDLAVDLERDRAVANEQFVRWNLNLFMTVVLLTVAALAVALALWFTLHRRIVDPLADLASKAEAVSRGALTQEVRTRAPGEIASLARAVDAMRVELVNQMAAAQEAAQEIAAAHQHLTEQAEELRRSNRDLEQFAYVASHDLQEPLRKVASFTQLLRKRYGGELDERADQYIDFAVDGAKRMQLLIQDLLGFSRVGRVHEPPAPVDLEQACRTAVATFDATIAAQGAVVEIGELPTIVGQPTLLVQLFQNLVGNSLKFRDPDRAPRITIGAARRGDGWELWCTDNGIGIDARYVDRVFVIFQRLHAKDVYDGTGIGLALCKKIVEYHGGEIWIDDAASSGTLAGTGTTVRWTLRDIVRVS